jgi:hypothetical protein
VPAPREIAPGHVAACFLYEPAAPEAPPAEAGPHVAAP